MTRAPHGGLTIILAAGRPAETGPPAETGAPAETGPPDGDWWNAALCGRTAMDWLLDTVAALRPDAFLVSGGHSAELADRALTRPALARASIARDSGRPGTTVVMSCRYPLLRPATIRRAVQALSDGAKRARADGAFEAVLIRSPGTAPWWSDLPGRATIAAMACTGGADGFPDWLAMLEPQDARTFQSHLDEIGARVTVTDAEPVEALRCDDAAERQLAAIALYQKVATGWQRRGVVIDDPATTRIDATVRIGRGARIRPHTELTGRTIVGAGATIGPVTMLADTTAGDECVIRYAVCEGVTIGDSANVGPFTWLRSGTRLGARTRAGSFVELADSVVGDDTQIPHVSGLLGAVVGKNCNIAGLSGTANFDGQAKHPIRIGDHVSIGAANMLIAPLTIGDGAYTAAGSVITGDVPGGALAISRSRQVNVDGWVARKMPDSPAAKAARRHER
jgi:acetyltransferase-like isoleucine patch superfamily enzyme